jgi:hypothetical protein
MSMISAPADAQQEDHGAHLQRGLGQSQPAASDVSHHPEWRVYEFQRDGISYYQVNDLAGRVHITIASADGVFWALPVGDVAAQTSLPSWRLKIPSDWPATEVYEAPQFSLVRYGKGNDAVWSVEDGADPLR